MKVLNRVYRMSRTEYRGLLKTAGEQVPYGIYAVEKADYAELKCDSCTGATQLKEKIRQYKSQGFKVHSNGRK